MVIKLGQGRMAVQSQLKLYSIYLQILNSTFKIICLKVLLLC